MNFIIYVYIHIYIITLFWYDLTNIPVSCCTALYHLGSHGATKHAAELNVFIVPYRVVALSTSELDRTLPHWRYMSSGWVP